MINLTLTAMRSTLTVSLFCAGSLLANDAKDAQAFIETELSKVYETVHDSSLSPTAKQAILEREIRQHIALGQMAVDTLGTQVASFNLQEFADFSKEFQEHLLNYYLQRAASFITEDVEVTEAIQEEETGTFIVKTLGMRKAGLFRSTASSSNQRITVEYHLEQSGVRWQIIDIVIDGVDINSNFNSQFRALLKRNSPQKVIDIIRERNQQKAKDNPFQ